MKKSILLEILVIVISICVAVMVVLPKMVYSVPRGIFTAQISRTYNTVNFALAECMRTNKVKSLYLTKAFNKNRSASTEELEKFIKKQLIVSKICTPKTEGGIDACMGKTYKSLKGEKVDKLKGEVCAIINGGATACFNRFPSKKAIVKLYLDSNGPKGPNIWGRDAFVLGVNDRGYISEDYVKDPKYRTPELCGIDPYGVGCFSKINDEYWMMKY